MAGTIVRISGLPSTCNPMKIQFLFSSECKVPIKSLKIDDDDGDAEVMFARKNDADVFRQCLPKTILFARSTFTVTLSANQPVQTDRAEGAVTAQAKRNHDDMHAFDNTKVYSWCDMDELPSCKMGLLLQCQREIHLSQISKYFESSLNGGPILDMIKMFDGLLIIFHKEEDASKAWSQRPHRISDISVHVFVKYIPTCFEEKLLVQSNDKDMDDQKVKNLLFVASPKGITPESIETRSNAFLAMYSKDIDIQDIKDIIYHFQVENEGIIKVSQLLKTDCIKVENASAKFSDEEYKILFENEFKSHGGTVTKILRDDDDGDILLVYFASYQVVENIVKSVLTNPLDICGHQLKIKSYFQCFHDLHENDLKMPTARAFQTEHRTDASAPQRTGLFGKVGALRNRHAKDHEVDEIVLLMEIGEIRYLTEYSKKFEHICADEKVTFFPKHDVGITFKGKKQAVDEVCKKVELLLIEILHDIYVVSKFGSSTFFNTKEGKKLVKEKSTKYKTAIVSKPSAKLPALSAQFGEICVSVYCGDITNETNDAIVNSVGATFDLNWGQVSQAILRKGGHDIMTQVMQAQGKNIRVTGAGRLHCRKIIHIFMDYTTDDKIEACLADVIDVAEQEKCSSISVPAFGTGNIGMHPKQIAKIFLKVFSDFEQRKLQYLKRIDIVIFDSKQMHKFTDGFKDIKPGTTSKFKKQLSNWTTPFGLGSGDSGNHAGEIRVNGGSPKSRSAESDRNLPPDGQVVLHFYSTSSSDITSAVASMKEEINSIFAEEVISHASIKHLKQEEVSRLQDYAKKYGVSVDKSERQIAIEGLKKGVYSAAKEIRDMLKKVPQTSLERDPLKNQVVYSWKIEKKDGTYRQLAHDISDAIEEKYQTSDKFVGKIKVRNEEYKVDLIKGKLNDKSIRRVRNKEWKSDGTKFSQLQSAHYSDDDVA